MSPTLKVEGLRKAYGGLVVSDGIDLEVRPGEIHALIGPNGAGKTTLVSEIAGAVTPDAGRVFLEGRDITGLPPHERARLGLARSFQITAVLPRFTVLENVTIAIQGLECRRFRFLPAPALETGWCERASAIIESVGLGRRVDTLAGSLSHGEKRMLEMAIVLARAPRLLLADEPMAGAGGEETAALVALLERLKGTVPVLLIEHDMDAVFALADRISVLVYGRIIASGTAAEIRANPEVQAAYLGSDEGLVA
ncbi:MAG: ABC transporter ATP-binding protein [Rhodobiaceae bacterium]|nr:ABC transporter ATP-binding protein [Rhodobiaceae bacterium]